MVRGIERECRAVLFVDSDLERTVRSVIESHDMVFSKLDVDFDDFVIREYFNRNRPHDSIDVLFVDSNYQSKVDLKRILDSISILSSNKQEIPARVIVFDSGLSFDYSPYDFVDVIGSSDFDSIERVFFGTADIKLEPRKPRVLVVDDENYKLYGEVLEKQGDFYVDVVPSAKDAIDYTWQYSYDLFVIDKNLPEMQGDELIKKLRSIQKDTNAVLISGGFIQEDLSQDKIEELGVSELLPKPISNDDLVDLIKRNVKLNIRKDGSILLVDEKDVMLEYMHSVLLNNGYSNLLLANSAEDAMSFVRDGNVDLVISDFYLCGDVSGADVLQYAKNHNVPSTVLITDRLHIPVNIVTQYQIDRVLAKQTQTSILNLDQVVAGLLDVKGPEVFPPVSLDEKGTLYVLTGPYGAGKTTIVNALLNNFRIRQLETLKRWTTRPIRDDEEEGEFFNFVSRKEFEEIQDKFTVIYEHGGNLYGNEEIDFLGRDLIVTPDHTGFKKYTESYDDVVSICVFAPEVDLRRRLLDRPIKERRAREKVLKEILPFYLPDYGKHEFDYLVFNFDLGSREKTNPEEANVLLAASRKVANIIRDRRLSLYHT